MSIWKDIQTHVADVQGRPVSLGTPVSVGGGCINQAYRVQDADRSLFVKLSGADGLPMFEAEANGLQELGQARGLRVPEPVCTGVSANQAYLVMENLELGGRGDPAALGEGLAALHRVTTGLFGWHRDNTIGSTPQRNQQEQDWLTFWRDHRLGFQLQLAARNGAGSRTLDAGARLLEALPLLLEGRRPEASLLHGDLWSGNYSFTRAGEPAIFDPAVYYGDREADLAMTELFGGFSQQFYAAYRSAVQPVSHPQPLQLVWRRLPVAGARHD